MSLQFQQKYKGCLVTNGVVMFKAETNSRAQNGVSTSSTKRLNEVDIK